MLKSLPLLPILTALLLFVSCKKSESLDTTVTPSSEQTDVVLASTVAEQTPGLSSEDDALSELPDIVPDGTSPEPPTEGPSITFCGLKGVDDSQSYKIIDWSTNSEMWIEKGSHFQDFFVVGMDSSGSVENLILEKDEFWFLYPLETTKSSDGANSGDRVSVLRAEDIPEGVDIMEYVSEHTIPMNSGEMPENMPVLNPDVDMDAIE